MVGGGVGEGEVEESQIMENFNQANPKKVHFITFQTKKIKHFIKSEF